MNILQWVGDNALNMVVTTAITLAGSFLAAQVISRLIMATKEQLVIKVVDILQDHITTPADKKLAAEVVRWVEIKFGSHPSAEKKEIAVTTLRKLFPILSEQDADQLIELGVFELNNFLKEIELAVK